MGLNEANGGLGPSRARTQLHRPIWASSDFPHLAAPGCTRRGPARGVESLGWGWARQGWHPREVGGLEEVLGPKGDSRQLGLGQFIVSGGRAEGQGCRAMPQGHILYPSPGPTTEGRGGSRCPRGSQGSDHMLLRHVSGCKQRAEGSSLGRGAGGEGELVYPW